tara:strand:- start:68 stop:901 length:834 start_codon:yes stop_codon:yes gene_type:complete
MVYFANFATSNFCLRGCNAGSNDPNNTEGMFNSAFVACFNWPNWTTSTINNACSSWMAYLNNCQIPFVDTNNFNATNSQVDSQIRFQGRPFSVNIHGKTGDGIASVAHVSPVSTGSSSSPDPGYKNVSLSSRQNFITVTCTLVYLYIFDGWRVGSSSGSVASLSQTTSFFFNSDYGGTNFLNIESMHAKGFTISDRRLKRNIKLVGKSNKGINIYTWKYKNPELHGYGVYQGVMAQEVPYATITNSDGYLMVDYSKTDVTFKKLYEGNLGNRKRQEG